MAMSLRNHARRLHHHLAHRDYSKLKAREALPQPAPQVQRVPADDSRDNEAADMATLVSVVFITAPKTFDGPAVMVTDVGTPLQFVSEPEPELESRPRPQPQPQPESGRNEEENIAPQPRPVEQPDDDRGRQDVEEENNEGEDNSRNDEETDRPRPSPPPDRGDETDDRPSDNLIPVVFDEESSSTLPPRSRDTDGPSGFDVDSTTAERSGSLASLTGSLAATATATAIAGEEDDESGGGISPGATAGIVISVLLVIGALLAGAFFYSRKKRRDRQGIARLNDEKSDDAANRSGPAVPPPPQMTSKASVRTARTASTAPRLSLRPLTAFVPNLASDGKANGNQLEMQSPFSPSTSREAPIKDQSSFTLSASPPTDSVLPGQAANDPSNPFGNHAEPVNKSPSSDRGLTAPPVPVAMPMSEVSPTPLPASVSATEAVPPTRPTLNGPLKTDSVSLISGVLPAGANGSQVSLATPLNGSATSSNASPDRGMAAAMAARSSPLAPDRPFAAPPKPLSVHSAVSVPLALGSPARADFGDSASIVSDGSGASPARAPLPNNVYRVQMDYTPAMEDELEIRAGQMIRLLHEYDDGWGLCIRLDRSQQGVVPRTCLSRHPVKPRNAGQQAPIPHGRPNPPQWGSPNALAKGSGSSPAQIRGLNHANVPFSAVGALPLGTAFSVIGSGPSQPFNGPPAVVFPAPPHSLSPSPAQMPGPVPMPMPISKPMQRRPASPAGQGRGSPGPASNRQQGQRNHSPHFRGPPPPRSLSPGPYVAYQRPSVPESRRRSNSVGDVAPLRLGNTSEQKSTPLKPITMNEPEAQALPQRKPVPGVAI